ncbi:MAG: dipeptidase [Lachnospiraceae bacterium]|nr:dipeptidase [Lachnospiraceae bacterium]
MGYFFADAHSDTISRLYETGEDFFENKGQLDLKRLLEYGAWLQFFALWLEPCYYSDPLNHTFKLLDCYYKLISEDEHISHANCLEDIIKNKNEGRLSSFLSIEGGEPLCGNVENLRIFHRLGVRALGLTWNYKNQLAQGVLGNSENGLTSFGYDVIDEAERLRILIDVSHLNDKGFFEAAGCIKGPFIASHSNSRAICPSARNLTDEQIKAIANHGGFIGLNAYKPFVCPKDGERGYIYKHIDHIINIAGYDILGFGCDFDGMDTPALELADVSKAKDIVEYVEEKHGSSAAEKFAGGNLLNVIKTVIG